jgi:hypothetical protein
LTPRADGEGWLVLMEVEPENEAVPVILALWDSLSRRCQEDLATATSGSIIRCTREDWENLRSGVVVIPPDDVF